MTDTESDSVVAKSWDTYWRGTHEAANFVSGGVSHSDIAAFWRDLLGTVRERYDVPRLVDIASGNGAVVECVKTAFAGELPNITCVDVSAQAIENLEARFPGVNGIVADARSIPCDDGQFDIVTSQFGIEYAGAEAFDEAARVIAPGGRLACLVHHRSGEIYKECEAALDAIHRTQDAKFIPHAIELFETGFAACRGAGRSPYESAAKRLAPAIRALESIMREHGEHVAGDTVARLYLDVDRIHRRIQHYEPADVLSWLGKMHDELEAFAGRLSSMLSAAIDGETFGGLCDRLHGRGFAIERGDALLITNNTLPLAWALIATKS